MNWKLFRFGFAVSVMAFAFMVVAGSSANAMTLFGGNKADLGDLFVIDSLFNGSENGKIFTKDATNLGDLFILDQLFNNDETVAPTPPVTPPTTPTPTTVSLAQRLSGRIILQVDSKGEAWYVNPVTSRRVALGTPSQLIARMSSVAIGISNDDFDSLDSGIPARLVGRFLIKTEDDGRLFYINPVDKKITEVNNATEAANLVRQVGLGISNSDIVKITIAN